MNVDLPTPGSPMGVVIDAIRRAFIPVVSQNEATSRILLRSPNGTSYSVTVDDAGVISTAVVDGKTRP